MRSWLVGITLLFWSLLSSVAFAQSDTYADRLQKLRIILAQQLSKDPDNRGLRFKYAQAAYQTGRSDAAKYHLRVLMRTSEESAELDLLRQAYATVVNESPWSFSLNFSILPSTNIKKTSYNEIFETLLGDFKIVGGGEQESGVGAVFGGEVAYSSVLENGVFLDLALNAERYWYPVERFSSYRGQVSASFGWQGLGGFTQVTPYFARSIYPEDENRDNSRYGARVSHELYLSDSASIKGTVRTELRDYDERDYLDGPFYSAALSFSNRFDRTLSIRLGGSVSRSEPEQEHLQYTGAALWGEVSKTFSDFGTVGLNASVGGSQYSGLFPAMNEARQDSSYSIGASFSTPRIKLFNATPKVACKFTSNSSNVALYEFTSTDCSLSFEQRF